MVVLVLVLVLGLVMGLVLGLVIVVVVVVVFVKRTVGKRTDRLQAGKESTEEQAAYITE